MVMEKMEKCHDISNKIIDAWHYELLIHAIQMECILGYKITKRIPVITHK